MPSSAPEAPPDQPPSPAVRRALRSVRSLFSLGRDTDHDATVGRITAQVDFRGGNIWALVLAILVASIGLNVNSTAVVIGAMLISPLMGPIMGAGLALGTNDLALLKRSLRNVVVAAAVSVAVSALYFAVSPLDQAQSELLARTRPTLYDVLLAFIGGSAGIIAVSRKGDTGGVIPGVAIATALMPPLCTAGFGLATGSGEFFFGAVYLFLINSVFIGMATLAFTRLLRFPRVRQLNPAREHRVRLGIAAAVVVTAVPSAYVAWTVVRESVFLAAARQFVGGPLQLPDRAILTSAIKYGGRDSSTIDVTLLGPPVSAELRAELDRSLAASGLERTRLILREPVKAGPGTEELSRVVRAGILDDLYRGNQAALEQRDTRIRLLEDEVVRLRAGSLPVAALAREIEALHPEVTRLGFARTARIGGPAQADTLTTVVTTWRRLPTTATTDRLRQFLARRLQLDSVDLVVRVEP